MGKTVLLFEGEDSNGKENLWVTDGTAAGTSELPLGSPTAGFFSVGVPVQFVTLGNQVLFTGGGSTALWASNGTAIGTQSLPAAGGAIGVVPGQTAAVLGSELLFSVGTSTTGAALYATDGTRSGTAPVTLPAGTGPLTLGTGATGALPLPDFAVLQGAPGQPNITLFGAQNGTSNTSVVWSSDGTGQGTNPLGVRAGVSLPVNPLDFTTFGTNVLFFASSNGQFGLWTTDGTASGTAEVIALTSVTSAKIGAGGISVVGSRALFTIASGLSNQIWATNGASGNLAHLNVNGLGSAYLNQGVTSTVFNGELLFAGTDSSQSPHTNLWVSDGTTAGTALLPVSGAAGSLLSVSKNSSGGYVAAPDFTVFGSQVLFAGYDAAGNLGLWTTDGTAAHTHEIAVAGASATGIAPSDFTVLGNKVVFDGTDAAGNSGLWVTDGTSAGTTKILSASNPDGGLHAVLSGPIVIPSPPAITGTRAGQTTNDLTPVAPFATVAIADSNAGQTQTLTVQLSSATSGFLTNFGVGSYYASTGVYSVTGTAAVVSAALDGLQFVPVTPTASATAQTLTTGFTITDTDTLGVSATDSTTTVAVSVPITQTIATDGTLALATALLQVGNLFLLDPAGAVAAGGNGPLLQVNHQPVTAGQFGSWQPIGAVKTATGGYLVAWRLPGATAQYQVWATDSGGNLQTVIIGPVPGSDPALQSVEAAFGQDLNNDGTIGPVRPVASSIATPITTLTQVGSQFAIQPATGTPVLLQFNGAPVTAGQFGAWTPVAATANPVAAGYLVAWKQTATGQYQVWAVDGSGAFTGVAAAAGPATSLALQTAETAFGLDLNGDGKVGPGIPASIIGTDNGTTLASFAGGYAMTITGGSGYETLQYNGAPVTPHEFGGWTPVGAVQTPGGYQVAWSNAGQYQVWNTDAYGNFTSVAVPATTAQSTALELAESNFGQDLNGDGTIGEVNATLSPAGAIVLQEVGASYVIAFSNPAQTPLTLTVNGQPVTPGQFAGWTPYGIAAAPGGGYLVAWKNAGAGLYTIWTVDSAGNRTGAAVPATQASNVALQAFEPLFGQDLNGDGTTGPTAAALPQAGMLASLSAVAPAGSTQAAGYLFQAGSNKLALQYNGAPVTAATFAGWAPIAATADGAGDLVAWRNSGTGQYQIWSTNALFQFTGVALSAVPGNNATLKQYENIFFADLNGDNVIGASPDATIAVCNLLQFDRTGSYYDFVNVTTGTPYELQYNGAPVTQGQFGAWTPLAVTPNGSGFLMAWRNGTADQYQVWNLDAQGNFTGVALPTTTGESDALQEAELTFGYDLNADGTEGPVKTSVPGGVMTAVADQYSLLGSVSGAPVIVGLSRNGSAVTSEQLGAWQPIAAVASGSGFLLALRNAAAGQYQIWSVGADGAVTGVTQPPVSGGSYALESAETQFNLDLNGDGTIGPVVTTLLSNTGGTLQQTADRYTGSTTAGAFTLAINGAPVTAGQFGAWAPVEVAADPLVFGDLVAWRYGLTSQYQVWTTDASGAFTGLAVPASAGSSLALEEVQAMFAAPFAGNSTNVAGKATTFPNTSLSGFVLAQVGANVAISNGTLTVPLQYNGAPVTATQFSGWAPIGACRNSGFLVAWFNQTAGLYQVWQTDLWGNFVSVEIPPSPGTDAALQSLEDPHWFGQDLNGDHTIGPGAVSQIGNNGVLQAAAGGYVFSNPPNGPLDLRYGGAAVRQGQFGAWAPLGAIALPGGGWQVAWRSGTGPGSQYQVWTTDATGNFTGTAVPVTTGTTYALENIETSFNLDLNNDGTVGPVASAIATDGGTTLTAVADRFALKAADGTGPWLQSGGAPVTAGQFGAWTPIGAILNPQGGGYLVAWHQTATNQYQIWTTDSSGNATGVALPTVAANDPRLENFELTFGQNLNADTTTGPTQTIATDKGTVLDATGTGYQITVAGQMPLTLQFNGAAVTAGQFGAWAPIGAVQQGGGYLVAWQNGTADQYQVWTVDSLGRFTGVAVPAVPGDAFALQDLEPAFGQDLNHDGQLSGSLVTGFSGGPGGRIDFIESLTVTVHRSANTVSALAGLNAPTLGFVGSPSLIALDSSPVTAGSDLVEYALTPASGIDVIHLAQLSHLGELDIDLMGASPSLLQAYDTTYNGQSAIAIASAADLLHGVVLANSGLNAATLMSSHLTIDHGHALFTNV